MLELVHLFIFKAFRTIPSIKSPLIADNKYRDAYGGQGFIPSESFVYRGSYLLEKNTFHQS